MGSTPSGSLYYGFPLEPEDPDEEYCFPWATEGDGDFDSRDWTKVVLAKRGIVEPAYSDREYEASAEVRQKFSEYWQSQWDLEKEVKEQYGVEIEFGGYDGSFSHYIAAHSFESSWGEMTPVSMEVKPEWDANIKAFCELVGIPYKQPQWYLTSLYF